MNDLIESSLARCTEPQRDMFNKIFPNGPTEEQEKSALELIERTIKKNNPKIPVPPSRGMTDNEQAKLRTWNAMEPKDRDYDRVVAKRIPRGATWDCETEGYRLQEEARDAERDDGDYEGQEGCACHVNPPCGFCTSMTEEETDVYCNNGGSDGGSEAVLNLRQEKANKMDDELRDALTLCTPLQLEVFDKKYPDGVSPHRLEEAMADINQMRRLARETEEAEEAEMIVFVSVGAEMIDSERTRQFEKEGYSGSDDDDYTSGQLVKAAHCYLMLSSTRGAPLLWPWIAEAWKPTPDNRIRELVKVGALVAAEIDRLLRKYARESIEAAKLHAEELKIAQAENPWLGMPIGLDDVKGNPVHYGDTLEFHASVWGNSDTNKYVLEFNKGITDCLGVPSEIPNHCTIIKKWDAQ